MQDQAFLGLEAALAVPDPGRRRRRALHRHPVAARGPQAGGRLPRARARARSASCSAASAAPSGPGRTSACRCTAACWPCAPAGPVKMQYGREESFFGHVHRHPARIWMRHHATADGRIVKIEARFLLDGGAYASTSSAVLVNAITHTQGPYAVRERRRRRLGGAHQQPAVRRHARLRRGAGVLRPRGPDGQAGRGVRPRPGRDPAAQRHAHRRPRSSPARSSRAWRRWPGASARPPPCRCRPSRSGGFDGDPMRLPGGAGPHRRRAATCAAASASPWPSRTSCTPRASTTTPRPAAAWPTASPRLKFATAEVGQGFVTIAQQIARTVLGVDEVDARADGHLDRLGRLHVGVAPDVDVGRRRRRRLPGGARAPVRARRPRSTASSRCGSLIDGTDVVDHARRAAGARRRGDRRRRASTRPSSTTTGPTEDLDDDGQGNCHTAFAFVAHRAVVDVDVELGLVKVVQVATAQDVGRALNPLSVHRPDRGRHRPGARPGRDGGDRHHRRPHPEPVVHRLPAADVPRRPRGRRHPRRGARPAGAARRQGRRRAAVHLGDARPSWPPSARRPGRDLNRVPVRPQDICLRCRSSPSRR